MFYLKWSSIFLLLTLLCAAHADHLPPPEGAPKSFNDHVVDTTADLSRRVEAVANSVDLLLAGKKYSYHRNDSQVSVSQIFTSIEGGLLQNSTDIGINLRLPNVEKRWQLRFSTYDEDEEERSFSQQIVRTAPRQKSYGAGLQFFRKLGDVKTTFQPRVQLKDPLDISYVLKFESEAKRESFRLQPKLEFLADSHNGVGEYFELGLFVPFAKRWEYSLVNSEEYHQRGNDFTTQNGMTLDHGLNDHQSVGLGTSLASENHPFHLNTITVSTNFNQVIYKNLLNLAVSPFLSFSKGDAFKGKAGFTVNLGAIF